MERIIRASLLAIALLLGIHGYSFAQVPGSTCEYTQEANLKDASDNGWAVAKLDPTDAALIAKDYQEMTGDTIAEGDLYLGVKRQDDLAAAILVVFKDGCTVGMYRANVENLETILGKNI